MLDAYDRADAMWLRLRGACRIAPASKAWAYPDRWLRRVLGLDPQRMTPADGECACIAMERDLRAIQAANRRAAPGAP
ncbi:hypothetical protein [Azospirillum thermophilum]|uniref:Uncharacterized protein n=1 Tax=Azospirillum thermophilum TaxID=2202148 RepID=A0A2S2D116_9PROT|nr:hypothetical protein [Azospirillum thermophilum]AWK90320.1 hypothetical protein DEW08_30355 [Azospirillum thermophilum]